MEKQIVINNICFLHYNNLMAKNKINYLTLKEGDIKYTIKLNNDSVNKKGINKI